jgi:alkylation response protein AidB-like acyl-CoA dehydrogenase
MAKLYASEMSVRVCEEPVQIHGGYTKDYPAEKYCVTPSFAQLARAHLRFNAW